jgi:hypothetical protein
LEFAHYIYNNKKHFITGSKGKHKSCIFCGSFYGDAPIEEIRKGEIYQIPYCSRKCETEDTESAHIIDEYIKICNIYKKKQAERDEQWDKEIEERNKKEKRIRLLKRIFWITLLTFIGYFYGDAIRTFLFSSKTSFIVNTKGLNLRTSPGTSGEIIKLMNQNDSIWQLQDSSQDIGNDTWVYVTDKIDTGWVNETYLN